MARHESEAHEALESENAETPEEQGAPRSLPAPLPSAVLPAAPPRPGPCTPVAGTAQRTKVPPPPAAGNHWPNLTVATQP